jgi:hypothetical protein
MLRGIDKLEAILGDERRKQLEGYGKRLEFEVAEREKELAEVRQLLVEIDNANDNGVMPSPTEMIKAYLEEKGEPTWESEIVEVLGPRRADAADINDPQRRIKQWHRISQSLQIHNNRNGKFECVERVGDTVRPADMKPKRKLKRNEEDTLDRYRGEYDNLFWFRGIEYTYPD